MMLLVNSHFILNEDFNSWRMVCLVATTIFLSERLINHFISLCCVLFSIFFFVCFRFSLKLLIADCQVID